MGTNYYRIPTEEELELKKSKLIKDIKETDFNSVIGIIRNFEYSDDHSYEYHSLWSKFLEGNVVHLGKRSSGWRFLWNFNKNKYYSNREELFNFIKSGRVSDEYGEIIDQDEFIKMALEWCQNGLVLNQEYFEKYETESLFTGENYYDLEIEGLRVSRNYDFS